MTSADVLDIDQTDAAERPQDQSGDRRRTNPIGFDLETHDTVPARRAVEDVLDLVRASADDIERARSLPDAVVMALRETHIHRLLMPAALGGLEAPVVDVMDTIEQIAAADGSTGWCAAAGAASNLFAGYLPEAGARTVFADPDQGSATVLAPGGRVVDKDGQASLVGRWPFTSNCLHSRWVGLGALLPRGDGIDPVPRLVFVPVAELTIEDTWDAVGLRGTGSHHVAARGVPVAAEHCARFADRPWPEGTLWRLPIHTVMLPTLVAVVLGIARGAVDEIARQVREGRTARRGQMIDSPISMAGFAIADTRLRAARAGLRDAVNEAHMLAAQGRPIDRNLQARINLACLHACDTSVEVTSTAHRLGGGAAVHRGNRLLRALCDVDAARQHLLLSHQHYAELGKVVAGLDVGYPPYIL